MNGKAQPIRCSPDANVSCTRHVHTTPQDHRDDGLPYGVTPQSIRRPLPFMSLRVTGSSDRLVAHSTKCLVPPACLLLAPVPPAAAGGVAQLHSVTQRKDEPSVTLSVPLLYGLSLTVSRPITNRTPQRQPDRIRKLDLNHIINGKFGAAFMWRTYRARPLRVRVSGGWGAESCARWCC